MGGKQDGKVNKKGHSGDGDGDGETEAGGAGFDPGHGTDGEKGSGGGGKADDEEEEDVLDDPRYASRSLFLCGPRNPLRALVIRLIESRAFKFLSLALIIVNSIFLAMYDPLSGEDEGRNAWLNEAETFFLVAFTVELVLRVVGMGLFMHEHSYLRSLWNWLDAVIVIGGLVDQLGPSGFNASPFRTFRVFRPLRTINGIHSMRVLMASLFLSLKPMINVFVLWGFSFFCFALVGVQIGKGVLRQRCYLDSDGADPARGTVPDFAEDQVCSTAAGGFRCPSGYECAPSWVNDLNFGFTSFDNVGTAMLVIFQITTLAGWPDYLTSYSDAIAWPMAFFIIGIVVFSSFVLIQLAISVLFEKYSEVVVQTSAADIEAEAEAAAAAAAAAAADAGDGDHDHHDDDDRDLPDQDFGGGGGGGGGAASVNPNRASRQSSAASGLPMSVIAGGGAGGTGAGGGGGGDKAHPNEPVSRERMIRMRLEAQRAREAKASRSGAYAAADDEERGPSALDRVRDQARRLIAWAPFEISILFVIFLNTLALASEHFDQPDRWTRVLYIANIVFTVIFTAELALKVFALGLDFVRDGLNVLDGIIVVIAIVELALDSGSGLLAFRVFRLLRLVKFARHWTSLRRIVRVMANSIPPTSSCFAMLSLFIFVYAVFGMQTFGGAYTETTLAEHFPEGKPRGHFDTFGWAVVTVLSVVVDEWTDPAYATMRATHPAAALYFVSLILIGSYVLLNLFLAILSESFDAIECEDIAEREAAMYQRELELEAEAEAEEAASRAAANDQGGGGINNDNNNDNNNNIGAGAAGGVPALVLWGPGHTPMMVGSSHNGGGSGSSDGGGGGGCSSDDGDALVPARCATVFNETSNPDLTSATRGYVNGNGNGATEPSLGGSTPRLAELATVTTARREAMEKSAAAAAAEKGEEGSESDSEERRLASMPYAMQYLSPERRTALARAVTRARQKARLKAKERGGGGHVQFHDKKDRGGPHQRGPEERGATGKDGPVELELEEVTAQPEPHVATSPDAPAAAPGRSTTPPVPPPKPASRVLRVDHHAVRQSPQIGHNPGDPTSAKPAQRPLPNLVAAPGTAGFSPRKKPAAAGGDTRRKSAGDALGLAHEEDDDAQDTVGNGDNDDVGGGDDDDDDDNGRTRARLPGMGSERMMIPVSSESLLGPDRHRHHPQMQQRPHTAPALEVTAGAAAAAGAGRGEFNSVVPPADDAAKKLGPAVAVTGAAGAGGAAAGKNTLQVPTASSSAVPRGAPSPSVMSEVSPVWPMPRPAVGAPKKKSRGGGGSSVAGSPSRGQISSLPSLAAPGGGGGIGVGRRGGSSQARSRAMSRLSHMSSSSTSSTSDLSGEGKTRESQDPFAAPSLEHRALFFLEPESPLRQWLNQMVHSRRFEAVMIVVITISSLLLAVEHPRLDPDGPVSQFLYVTDVIFTVVFCAEALAKVLALGFVAHRGAYLRNPWNVLDLGIVCVSVVTLALQSLPIKWLRSLRALRPLRLASRVDSLRVVLATLLKSVPAMVNVLCVNALFILAFAVMGVYLFGGKMYSCTDPSVTLRAQCAGAFYDSAVGATVERAWVNSPHNYDDVLQASLTLFGISTLDNWPSRLYEGVDAVSHDEAPRRDHNPAVALFFVVFLAVVGMWMTNFFLVTIISEFTRLQAESDGSAFLTERQKQWISAQKAILRATGGAVEVPVFEGEAAERSLRARVYRLVSSAPFDNFILVMIVVNVLLMSIEHFDQPDPVRDTLYVANTFFLAVFFVEAALKIFAMTFRLYWQVGWNRFDFLVVIAALVGFAVEESGMSFGLDVSVFRVLRILRVLRAVRRLRGLRALTMTIWRSIPSVTNIAALLLLVVYVYAVAGVAVFGEIEHRGSLGAHLNFDNAARALLTLSVLLTGEGWTDVMADAQQVTLAWLFFVSFQVIANYVGLSLFVALVVDQFTAAADDNKRELSPEVMDVFFHEWSHFDHNGDGYADMLGMPSLLYKIGPPLGIPPEATTEEAFAAVRKLRLPTYPGGKVHIMDVVTSLSKTYFRVEFLGGGIPRGVAKAWERKYALKGSYNTDNLAAAERSGYTPKEFNAAIKVQRAWRSVILWRKLQEGVLGK